MSKLLVIELLLLFWAVYMQVAYPQIQQNETPINQDREESEENQEERDSDSDKNSTERNEDDETQSDKSSGVLSLGMKEDSDNDDDELDKKSRRSSSAGSKRSSSSREEEAKDEQDEKPDEDKAEDAGEDEVADNLSYEEKVKKALTGDMNFNYPEKVKIVRVFTSSTFTGTLRNLRLDMFSKTRLKLLTDLKLVIAKAAPITIVM